MTQLEELLQQYDVFEEKEISEIINKFNSFPDNLNSIKPLHAPNQNLKKVANQLRSLANKFIFLNYVASHSKFSLESVFSNEDFWNAKIAVYVDLVQEYKELIKKHRTKFGENIPDLTPRLYYEGGKTTETSEKNLSITNSKLDKYKLVPTNLNTGKVEDYITTKLMEHLHAKQLCSSANLSSNLDKLSEIGGFLSLKYGGDNLNELYFHIGDEPNHTNEFTPSVQNSWNYKKLFSENDSYIIHWHTHLLEGFFQMRTQVR